MMEIQKQDKLFRICLACFAKYYKAAMTADEHYLYISEKFFSPLRSDNRCDNRKVLRVWSANVDYNRIARKNLAKFC